MKHAVMSATDEVKEVFLLEKSNKRNHALPNPKNDGITHINLHYSANTELGKSLGVGNLPFKHPILGYFRCLEAYWLFLYLDNPSNEVRNYNRKKARKEKALVKPGKKVKHFKEMMVSAYVHMLVADPTLKQLAIENTLPFECYDIIKKGDLLYPTSPAISKWLVDMATEACNRVKLNKIFKEDEDISIYSDVINKIITNMEEESTPVE